MKRAEIRVFWAGPLFRDTAHESHFAADTAEVETLEGLRNALERAGIDTARPFACTFDYQLGIVTAEQG